MLLQGHMKMEVPQKALEYEPMDLERFAAERAEGSAANLRRPPWARPINHLGARPSASGRASHGHWCH